MGITKTDPSNYGHLRGSTPMQGAARQAAAVSVGHAETLRFHTPTPIPYHEQDASCSLSLDVSLTCEGECDWNVCDAALFGKNCLPGAELNEHLENEICLALEAALTKLSAAGVPFAELPGRSDEIGRSLAEDLFPLWRERLGIQATRFCLTSAAPRKEDMDAIGAIRLQAKLSDPEEMAKALKEAQDAAVAAGAWICAKCGMANNGNFCTNCGTKKPE